MRPVPSSSAVVSLSVSVQRSYNRLRSRSPSKPQRGERRVTDLCTKSAGDHLSCRHLDYISHRCGIAFWNNINLDLTGAQLIDFVVWDCHLRRGVSDGDLHRSGLFRRGALRPKGQFLQHDLHGSSGFDRATFTGTRDATSRACGLAQRAGTPSHGRSAAPVGVRRMRPGGAVRTRSPS